MAVYMVFDVESLGLHGESFAVGWVVVDLDKGLELGCDFAACNHSVLRGAPEAYQWVDDHVPFLPSVYRSPAQIRRYFWEMWRYWHTEHGAMLAADVNWPVESRFLCACVDAKPAEREWQGPYPLIDVASCRLAAGFDPLATEPRLADEMPAHNPLCDARQSARLLRQALRGVNMSFVKAYERRL
jgi:hypothetical protein